MTTLIIAFAYVVSAILFVFGLKKMNSPATAVKGNQLSMYGMAIAILATLISGELDFKLILIGVAIGGAIGYYAAKTVDMTQMPEMVALFNGSGGLASLLLGSAEFVANATDMSVFTGVVTVLAILIGGVTFTGSLVAFLKLAEKIDGKPITSPLMMYANIALLVLVVFFGFKFSTEDWAGTPAAQAVETAKDPGKVEKVKSQAEVLEDLDKGKIDTTQAEKLLKKAQESKGVSDVDTAKSALSESLVTNKLFLAVVLIALVLGVTLVLPIGGADMPVAISLLNSYSGLAACAAGYVISNSILIVAGSLVGAAGLILTNIMCKAMNRSIGNVIFSGMGTSSGAAADMDGEAKASSPGDAYYVLEAAQSVVIVPGYGLAVAQAQHVVRELGEHLEHNGTEVKYAIHPVAGRMPGHMNVLLAEANVPYEQLIEMDDINPQLKDTDVVIVIGANDVVNPAARDDENSIIAGMPIINADYAKNVYIIKRSMSFGYAGIDNQLFYNQNSRMLFGDAKGIVEALNEQFKG